MSLCDGKTSRGNENIKVQLNLIVNVDFLNHQSSVEEFPMKCLSIHVLIVHEVVDNDWEVLLVE